MPASAYNPAAHQTTLFGTDLLLHCDLGCRGTKTVGGTAIILPAPPLKRDRRRQRDLKRKRCRRKAAIEPIIGHLKSDFRLARNYLKGTAGDLANALLATAAWNLRLWLRAFLPWFWSVWIACKGITNALMTKPRHPMACSDDILILLGHF